MAYPVSCQDRAGRFDHHRLLAAVLAEGAAQHLDLLRRMSAVVSRMGNEFRQGTYLDVQRFSILDALDRVLLRLDSRRPCSLTLHAATSILIVRQLV